MDFPFDADKATEAACRFVILESGTISVLKLVKLIYLLDRFAIQQRGNPVVGGAYFSMKNGPVTSEVLDLINAGEIAGVRSTWSEFISSRQNNEIAASKSPSGFLSEAELGFLDVIYKRHAGRDQWELRDWCHQHCSEWTTINSGRASITPADLAKAVGKTEEQVEEIVADANEAAFVQAVI